MYCRGKTEFLRDRSGSKSSLTVANYTFFFFGIFNVIPTAHLLIDIMYVKHLFYHYIL